MTGLSFVTLLAYDWKYALHAIRAYYAIADEIILGLDADRISWSHKPFVFDDQALARFIAEIDVEKKIRIIESNFHGHNMPIENDTWERRRLALACRQGNWVIQIDADEILLHPREWKNYFQSSTEDVRVYANWLPIYKIIGDKALIVAGRPEATTVATRAPHRYTYARVTDQPAVLAPLFMLHLAWGRTEEELVQKVTNWGHSTEIDIPKTVGLWRATNLDNYHQRRDFHPLLGPLWQCLKVIDWPPTPLVEGHWSLQQMIDMLELQPPDNRVFVQGKTPHGGTLISFGPPQPPIKNGSSNHS
jgi:hypothetical protein